MGETPKDDYLHIAVSESLKRKIRGAAGWADQPMSEWVREQLEDAADRVHREHLPDAD